MVIHWALLFSAELILTVDKPRPPKFAKLALHLEQPTWGRDPAWRFPFHNYAFGDAGMQKDWEAMEAFSRRRVDAAVAEWLNKHECWPLLPPKDDYFLHLRFLTTSQFLWLFPDEESSLLPFPDVADGDFLAWLLVDWWREKGSFQALHCVEARRHSRPVLQN